MLHFDTFMTLLPTALLAWGGVFVATGAVALAVAGLNRIFRGKGSPKGDGTT